MVHGPLQRPGFCGCSADRSHSTFTCRNRVSTSRLALPLEHRHVLRCGSALEQLAVSLHAHDQVTRVLTSHSLHGVELLHRSGPTCPTRSTTRRAEASRASMPSMAV